MIKMYIKIQYEDRDEKYRKKNLTTSFFLQIPYLKHD
jgi:hypothetical protein